MIYVYKGNYGKWYFIPMLVTYWGINHGTKLVMKTMLAMKSLHQFDSYVAL